MKLRSFRGLDLQAKIVVVLIAVMVPVFAVITIAANQLTVPFLVEEMRQLGSAASKNLSTQIQSRRVLPAPLDEKLVRRVDRMVIDQVYFQPQIIRMEVWVFDAEAQRLVLYGSNIQSDALEPRLDVTIPEYTVSELKEEESGDGQYWEIVQPLMPRSKSALQKPYGLIRTQVSLRSVDAISAAFWRVIVIATMGSLTLLTAVLSFFLRRTIQNDRLLRRAQDRNLLLAEQLHEVQRTLMNTEKLAIMGQLTASFAHEIGTPLNAMSGHLQLLKEESGSTLSHSKSRDRIGIISGQLDKIADIVRGFLQSTAKPASQKQLVDLNPLIEKTLDIVNPRAQAAGVEVRTDLDRGLGPMRMVPVDLEQVFLNLLNNAIDSLRAKAKLDPHAHLELLVQSAHRSVRSAPYALLTVRDTGLGIKKTDIDHIFKPFYTTKASSEGTGLGLTICQEILSRYHGRIEVDSKEGGWTRFQIWIPYALEAET